MKRSTMLAAAGLATVLTAAAGAAQAFEISCPLPQIRREVVTPLPPGWWQTPIINNLVDTEVINIGGNPALQCRYGGAGSIQRQAPGGMNCSSHPGGFTCLPPLPPPPPPAPPPFSTGPITLNQTYLVNLDNGAITSGPQADLWFEAVTPFEMYLSPRNGAQMAVGDRSNRGFDGCAHESFSSSRVPLAAVPVGSYVCMRTNLGRISQFRMNAISGGYPKVLSMGYTTW